MGIIDPMAYRQRSGDRGARISAAGQPSVAVTAALVGAAATGIRSVRRTLAVCAAPLPTTLGHAAFRDASPVSRANRSTVC